jgi:hypothetical protein
MPTMNWEATSRTSSIVRVGSKAFGNGVLVSSTRKYAV